MNEAHATKCINLAKIGKINNCDLSRVLSSRVLPCSSTSCAVIDLSDAGYKLKIEMVENTGLSTSMRRHSQL